MNHLPYIDLALAALLTEAAAGYPAFVYRVIRHPVTWMALLLVRLEVRLNRPEKSEDSRRLDGAVTLAVLLAATLAGALVLQFVFDRGWVGWIFLVLVATSLLAQRSLHEHVRAVADALTSGGLDAGRQAVSMIVGRNPSHLDEAGVARAAIESLAENFSDGVVAPAFWMAVGGLAGAACYKATNTADSMVGHKTPRYAAFGWASARLDDLINLPASRLSALFLVLGAAALAADTRQTARAAWGDAPPAAWREAARAAWRDAAFHRSPNAGWPEAAMAGALGLQLAGPRVYGETRIDDAFMGEGRRDATAADILRALRLYKAACVAQWLVLLGIILIVHI